MATIISMSVTANANGVQTVTYYSDGTSTLDVAPPYHYTPKSQMLIQVWYYDRNQKINNLVTIDVPGKKDRISYESLLCIFKQIEAQIAIPNEFKRIDMIFVHYGGQRKRIEFTHLDEVLLEPDVTLELTFM